MTQKQLDCYAMLVDMFCGEHHIPGIIKECGTSGILINCQTSAFSTYDFDELTRLVVMGHDRCIRVEIVPSGPNMIGLRLYKRKRDGKMWERHPTLEDAIASVRKRFPIMEKERQTCPVCEGDGIEPGTADTPCDHCGGDGREQPSEEAK